jgi:SNF2 family DNA or RNA helicase
MPERWRPVRLTLRCAGCHMHDPPIPLPLRACVPSAPPPPLIPRTCAPSAPQALCPGLNAELRGYQLSGVKWLISLWSNGVNGILADQM